MQNKTKRLRASTGGGQRSRYGTPTHILSYLRVPIYSDYIAYSLGGSEESELRVHSAYNNLQSNSSDHEHEPEGFDYAGVAGYVLPPESDGQQLLLVCV